MKIVTKPTLLVNHDEKCFLDDLMDMCQTGNCETCPLQKACNDSFQKEVTFEEFLNDVLNVVEEEKENKK